MAARLRTPVHKNGYTITNGKDGYTGSYIAIVDQLTGNVHQKLYDAENHPDLPVLYQAHPVIPMFLKSKTAKIANDMGTAANVTLQWGQLEEGEGEDEGEGTTFATLEIVSSAMSKETNLDKDGNDITVEIDVQRPELGAGLQVIDTLTQAGVWTKNVNQWTLKASRREPVSGMTRAEEYDGKINSTPFAGKAAGTLYAIITGRSVLSGVEWDLSYEFIYNPDGWDPTVFYLDPGTNAPAENLEEGRGIKTVEGYERADFNQLDII